jgi:hypothetical protein
MGGLDIFAWIVRIILAASKVLLRQIAITNYVNPF